MTSKLRRKRAEEIMERYTRRNMVYRQHPRPANPEYWRWLTWHTQWIVTCRRVINKG